MSIDNLMVCQTVTCSSVRPVRVSSVAVKSLSLPMSFAHGQVLNRAHTLERRTHVTSGLRQQFCYTVRRLQERIRQTLA